MPNKPNTPESRPAIEPAKPETEQIAPWRTLPEIQQEVAEVASDMIVNGGDQEDVGLLITAVLRHKWRRYMSRRPKSLDDTEKEVDEAALNYAARGKQDRYKKLARYWPDEQPTTTTTPDKPKATTVVEMVRDNFRKKAREAFEDFMANSGVPEEVHLLGEILELAAQGNPLIEAISIELQDAHTYVHVPDKHVARVRDFLKFLEDDCCPSTRVS